MDKDDEKFFYEDEVAMVSQKTGLVKYGLVLTTNKSRSETELKKNLYKNPNEIKVVWHPNGTEEIISDNKVVLIDRSLMPGDVVRKVSEGKPSQFGYCENIDIYATVKILNTNKVIENINCRNFTHTKPFLLDSSVLYESWVGGVYDVKCKVTFVSQDGSIFTLEDPYRQDFISLSTSDSFSVDDNIFYPGQKLKMCLDSLENAKFITISNLMSCLWHNYKKKYLSKFGSKWIKVYVQDLAVSSVEVEWYCQTSNKTKPRQEHWPERLVTGDNLKKLKTVDFFESCSMQVGDTYWYTIKDIDKLITMKQWRNKSTETFIAGSDILPSTTKKKKHLNKLQNIKNLPESTLDLFSLEKLDDVQNTSNQNVSTIQVQTVASVENNSKNVLVPKKIENKPSTSTTGNSSIHTLKSSRLKRNRMWKSLVKKSKQFNVPKVSTKSNSKVVVEICYTKSIADIIWQDGTRESGVSSTDLYPVQTLDDLEFFPGDFVTEKNSILDVYGVIESVDHVERTARVQWFKVNPENPSLPNPIEKTDFSVYDLRDHPDFHFKSGSLIIYISHDVNPNLSTVNVGQVLNAGPDGRILVMWVNGEKTECWPQELFVVKLHDDDDDDYSYQDEQYEYDDNNLTSFTHDDGSSEEWTSSPESSNKSRDQENNERCPKLLFQSLKQATLGMKSFLDAFEHNGDVDKVVKLKKSLEQIRIGFSVSSFLPTSDTKDLEITYKDLMDNVTQMIEKFISKMDNNEGAEDELSYKALMKESVLKLKNTVSDFMEKVNHAFKESTTVMSSKHKKVDQSDNNDLVTDNVDTDMVEVVEPTLALPKSRIKTIQDPEEMKLIVISRNTNSECDCEVIAKPEEAGVFDVIETLQDNSHKFANDKENINPTFLKIVTKDIQILKKSLPAGIWVKTFESRMDLFCVMIRGPEKTPYAGGLFMFDVKLPNSYPLQPPLCYYYSFCEDRLNPNLYEDGKVCLSLLGTWAGQGVELWSPKDSNILQLLVSIQGLILVNEPYYNEAGFDSQRGQQLAKENSRVYNEMVLIKVVQSMTNMLTTNCLESKSAAYFKEEIMEHVKFHGPKLISTIENWIKMSERELTEEEKLAPGYPLLPLSKGFCLSVKKALIRYKEILISMNIMFK